MAYHLSIKMHTDLLLVIYSVYWPITGQLYCMTSFKDIKSFPYSHFPIFNAFFIGVFLSIKEKGFFCTEHPYILPIRMEILFINMILLSDDFFL